jgi:SAM-dependent methyltransferase
VCLIRGVVSALVPAAKGGSRLMAIEAERVTRGHGLLEGLLARRRVRMAKRLIPATHREGSILDIGHGAFPLFLSEVEAKERHGIDRISIQAANDWARHGIHLVCQDLDRDCHLPYADGYFSVVTMLAVFEHISPHRLPELLLEVHRVLRTGGVYVLTTPAPWTGWLLASMSRLGLVSRDEIDEHQRSYSQGEIREALKDAGFLPGRIRTGTFEVFANNWAVATK